MAKQTRYIALVSTRIPKPQKRDRNDKRNVPTGGHGRLTFQAITFYPEQPTIIEHSVEGTFVTKVRTSVFAYAVRLIDDAGGRFKLEGNDIVAGPVDTDYEVATSHTITVRCGTGIDQIDKSVVVKVINVNDGPQDNSHLLLDQDSNFILDQYGNYIWD